MDPTLGLGYGLVGVALAATLRDLRKGLSKDCAPGWIRAAAFLTYIAWAGIAVATVAGLVPWFMPIVVFALPLAALLVTPSVVDRVNSRKVESLRREYYRILDTARRENLTVDDFERLKVSVARLSRFANAETSEWICLVQEEFDDWIRQVPRGPHAVTRDSRIEELGAQLFGRP